MYVGTLGTAHLRSVVRCQLRACGFRITPDAYRSELHMIEVLGVRARDVLTAEAPQIARLAVELPQLWERLPSLLGFGWRQASLGFGGMAEKHDQAGMLGAAFNAAIVLYDQLADERAEGGATTLVTSQTIAHIFANPLRAAQRIQRLAAEATEPRHAAFLTLLAQCALRGACLRVCDGPSRAWDHLGALVRELFTANDAALNAGAYEAAVAKSRLPSEIALSIALLAQGAVPLDSELGIPHRLGTVFSLVDDLADLIDDLRRGAPNTIAAALPEGRLPADADLYDATADGVVRLVSELTALDTEAAEVMPDAPGFARAMVAAWTNWPRNEQRAALRDPQPDAIQAAFEALQGAQRAGYAEATHYLRFPRLDWTYETHPACLAQRAVILDALLDARDVGVDVPEEVVAAETATILRSKHRGVRGGWSYVPTVPELPPDADDLGQVLQALVRVGGAELASTADDGIRILLDAACDDGGIVTWAVDWHRAQAADVAVRAYLPVMGGWGVHPEVVANFALGLELYDRRRFALPLQRIAYYLESAQEPDGWWPSRWYDGRYYGTYKALAWLAPAGRAPDAVERGRAFLLRAMRSDGSWGVDSADPLATAFGVLGLAAAARDADGQAIQAGARALSRMQRSDGTWEARPWIAFETVSGREVFSSATITTAYALKALCATVRKFGHAALRALATA